MSGVEIGWSSVSIPLYAALTDLPTFLTTATTATTTVDRYTTTVDRYTVLTELPSMSDRLIF